MSADPSRSSGVASSALGSVPVPEPLAHGRIGSEPNAVPRRATHARRANTEV